MRISDWSSDVCSSDLPVAVTGADRIEQTIPEHRPGKVEAQRIAAVTADGIDPVALDDAVQARRNVTDRFLVRRFDIAIADTLHRPRQALWMIDYLCRRLALAAEVAPAERIFTVGLDLDHPIALDHALGAAHAHAVLAKIGRAPV